MRAATRQQPLNALCISAAITLYGIVFCDSLFSQATLVDAFTEDSKRYSEVFEHIGFEFSQTGSFALRVVGSNEMESTMPWALAYYKPIANDLAISSHQLQQLELVLARFTTAARESGLSQKQRVAMCDELSFGVSDVLLPHQIEAIQMLGLQRWRQMVGWSHLLLRNQSWKRTELERATKRVSTAESEKTCRSDR